MSRCSAGCGYSPQDDVHSKPFRNWHLLQNNRWKRKSAKLGVEGVCTRLTIRHLSDQVGNEEPGRSVGKLVASQFQLLVETHNRCILKVW